MNHRQPVFYQQTATGWTPPKRRSFQALKLNDDLQPRMKDAANRSLQITATPPVYSPGPDIGGGGLRYCPVDSSTLELTFSFYHRHLFFFAGLAGRHLSGLSHFRDDVGDPPPTPLGLFDR